MENCFFVLITISDIASRTVQTDLSRGFWKSVPSDDLFEPEYAAERLIDVVANLTDDQRGKVWDWAAKEVPW